MQREPPLYTNRIHFYDCVSVMVYVLRKKCEGQNLPSVILASDNEPATRWDVKSWLAQKIRVPSPSPTEVSLNAGQNKRCDNSVLKQLGYQFIYPSY